MPNRASPRRLLGGSTDPVSVPIGKMSPRSGRRALSERVNRWHARPLLARALDSAPPRAQKNIVQTPFASPEGRRPDRPHHTPRNGPKGPQKRARLNPVPHPPSHRTRSTRSTSRGLKSRPFRDLDAPHVRAHPSHPSQRPLESSNALFYFFSLRSPPLLAFGLVGTTLVLCPAPPPLNRPPTLASGLPRAPALSFRFFSRVLVFFCGLLACLACLASLATVSGRVFPRASYSDSIWPISATLHDPLRSPTLGGSPPPVLGVPTSHLCRALGESAVFSRAPSRAFLPAFPCLCVLTPCATARPTPPICPSPRQRRRACALGLGSRPSLPSATGSTASTPRATTAIATTTSHRCRRRRWPPGSIEPPAAPLRNKTTAGKTW
jgi:hypothetical protein